MTRPTDSTLFDQRVADWLEEDPSIAPPQLLETVRAAMPSIPQRGPVVRWRLASAPAGVRYLAIAAALILVAILGATVVKPPTVGPSAVPSGLTNRVDVPLHFYSIALPPGWDVTLATGSGRPDLFQGPEGSLTVTLALIPRGTGQNAWADAYVTDQMRRRGGTCAGVDPGAYEAVRVGADFGRMYALPCGPNWLALTAVGDRVFDIGFSIRGGTSAEAARSLFADLLLGMTFDQGQTPPLALTTFTSDRYGFSIGYPTRWNVTRSTEDAGAFDIPWSTAKSSEVMEGSTDTTGPGVNEPGQPSDGSIVAAASTVPAGTTLDELISKTANIACGGGDTTADITIDGKPGKLLTFDNCQGDFQQWALILDGTRAYHVVWLNYPGTEGFDRAVFEQILAGFHFPGSEAPSPAASPVSQPLPDALLGAWYHPAPAFMTFFRAGDPYCVDRLRTELDCALWHPVGLGRENAIATLQGDALSLAFKTGFCSGGTTVYTMALSGDSLVLTERPGGCQGGNLHLVRAGTGGTPTSPPEQ